MPRYRYYTQKFIFKTLQHTAIVLFRIRFYLMIFFQVVYNNYQSECALHLKSVMKTICEFSGNIALYSRGTLGFPLIARSIISNFKNIYLRTCTIFICEQYMRTIHRNEMQVLNSRYIEVAASSSLLELVSMKIHNF